VAAALDGGQRSAGHLGQGLALGGGGDRVVVADNHDGGAGDLLAEGPEVGGVLEGGGGGHGPDEGFGVGLQAQPIASSIGLVECGSLKACSTKKRANSG
jgi:hypothetical protein